MCALGHTVLTLKSLKARMKEGRVVDEIQKSPNYKTVMGKEEGQGG